ncbi:hypothetical protein AGMMS50276_24430 [Synergistales bacterium]|nr:hypothetical protein AGMMS50276_24430 [Synergistales bacterium]
MALTSFDEKYLNQLNLVLQILPVIAREGTFALKGGTAINLFERGLPRLSVDIDLCYPRFSEREQSLNEIITALETIRLSLSKQLPTIKVDRGRTTASEYKLLCATPQTVVKIEVNTTMRGHAFPLRVMSIHQQAEALLGQYVEMTVVSREELFGGKICAALDRQHPRDLFDVNLLLMEEGLPRPIILGFLVCLISHNRPIHELLSPNRQDMREAFYNQFDGMSDIPFTYEEYMATKEQLVSLLHTFLSTDDRLFLLSFKKGEPNWLLLGVEGAVKLPAVLWKLQNIRRLRQDSPQKHLYQLSRLQAVLDS